MNYNPQYQIKEVRNTEAILKIKSVNTLFVNIVDSICGELNKSKSIKTEVFEKVDYISFRFSSNSNISFDIVFDFTDIRVSFFLFEPTDKNTFNYYEVIDDYLNTEIEAELLNKYIIEILSNPIKIISIETRKGNTILKKYFEYVSVVDNHKSFSKGYLINKIIFPWQKTEIKTKVYEPWINKK